MKSILTLLSLGAITLAFTGCLEETTQIGSPQRDGFSDPEVLQFSAEEFTKLNESLVLTNNAIPLSVVDVPRHIGATSGLTEVRQSSSEARKALLGRVLFYDTRVSATGETSCASCHDQQIAFSDDKAFSDGINGAVTKRNSIALGSVPTFAPVISGYGSSGDEFQRARDGDVRFFWDERAGTIKEQSEQTIADELEMGKDIHELSSELKEIEMYRILTMKAFGTTELTPDRITLALERFTSSIVSMNTRFDALADESFRGGNFLSDATDQERNGMRLFLDNCASCHGESMGKPFVTVANNGLDEISEDKGIGEMSGVFRDNGVFKVPFLRNVALTGPYMHDGRFETLREVIDHYSDGIRNHPNLHRNLRAANGITPRRMNFTEEEKQALVSFLEMTTDQTVLTDERFSDPFRR